jgi:hypothetical protein
VAYGNIVEVIDVLDPPELTGLHFARENYFEWRPDAFVRAEDEAVASRAPDVG